MICKLKLIEAEMLRYSPTSQVLKRIVLYHNREPRNIMPYLPYLIDVHLLYQRFVCRLTGRNNTIPQIFSNRTTNSTSW